MPYYIDEEDDVRLTETVAIMKYICRKYKPEMLGATAKEQGRVEMLLFYVAEIKEKATNACYFDGDREAIIANVRPMLVKLAQVLASYNNPNFWLAGSENLTYLDFYFAELLDMLDKLSLGVFY